MNMNLLLDEMTANAERIRALVQGLPVDRARWKPDPDTWSVLEVVNHLADEEALDFRVRLEITLFQPDEAWPPIDPEGWVTERNYIGQDLNESLQRYLDVRHKNLSWLQGIGAPDWNLTYQAPWGEIRAGDLLAAWAAHDLLHTRQLIELHWAFLADQSAPFGSQYAGTW
jgi:hypothetical protein